MKDQMASIDRVIAKTIRRCTPKTRRETSTPPPDAPTPRERDIKYSTIPYCATPESPERKQVRVILPLYPTLENIKIGTKAYTVPWVLARSQDGRLWVDGRVRVDIYGGVGGTSTMVVRRVKDGVDVEYKPHLSYCRDVSKKKIASGHYLPVLVDEAYNGLQD